MSDLPGLCCSCLDMTGPTILACISLLQLQLWILSDHYQCYGSRESNGTKFFHIQASLKSYMKWRSRNIAKFDFSLFLLLTHFSFIMFHYTRSFRALSRLWFVVIVLFFLVLFRAKGFSFTPTSHFFQSVIYIEFIFASFSFFWQIQIAKNQPVFKPINSTGLKSGFRAMTLNQGDRKMGDRITNIDWHCLLGLLFK